MTEGEPTRREFVDLMLAGAFGMTAIATIYPAVSYLIPPEGGEAQTASTVLPFPAEELAANSGRIFKFGNKPGLVLKTAGGEVRAFSAQCTHLSCIVQYAPAERRILCNCHSGWYDLTGKNVAGPPPRPLEAYVVNLRRRPGGPEHDIVVSRA
ncbi:MAG TPA: ubiquinol-cytochrome c reductase iron-sulfur subunit [Candidatus Limnocylindrales bacterium]|nr:ubiquinol-cytochrome c reductase iron-sulfur subunit [Candidatus Limnocylindrales bacterium]